MPDAPPTSNAIKVHWIWKAADKRRKRTTFHGSKCAHAFRTNKIGPTSHTAFEKQQQRLGNFGGALLNCMHTLKEGTSRVGRGERRKESEIHAAEAAAVASFHYDMRWQEETCLLTKEEREGETDGTNARDQGFASM